MLASSLPFYAARQLALEFKQFKRAALVYGDETSKCGGEPRACTRVATMRPPPFAAAADLNTFVNTFGVVMDGWNLLQVECCQGERPRAPGL